MIPKADNTSTQHFRVEYSYGIKLPNIFGYDIRLGKESGIDLLQKDTQKVRSKVKVHLEFIKVINNPPPGYQKITEQRF